MKKSLGFAVGAVALAMLAAPYAANAATAYTTTVVNLRAGPGIEYPVVFPLHAGTGLETYGCVQDWSWCDVSVGGYRGWVYGGYLAYPYENGRVSVLDYGPRIGLPVITFVFGDYWDHNYRNRTFYRDRTRYENVGVRPYRPYGSTNTNFNRDDNDRTRFNNNNDRNDRTRSFNNQNNQPVTNISPTNTDKTMPPGQVKRNDTTPVAPPGQDKIKAVPPGQVQRTETPNNKGADNRGAGNNNKGGNKSDKNDKNDKDDDQNNQGGPRR